MKLSPIALSRKSFVEKLRTAHDLAFKLYVLMEDIQSESSDFSDEDDDFMTDLCVDADFLQSSIYECYNDEENGKNL